MFIPFWNKQLKQLKQPKYQIEENIACYFCSPGTFVSFVVLPLFLGSSHTGRSLSWVDQLQEHQYQDRSTGALRFSLEPSPETKDIVIRHFGCKDERTFWQAYDAW